VNLCLHSIAIFKYASFMWLFWVMATQIKMKSNKKNITYKLGCYQY
jgi:hypothetical protein